ncbi:TPA: hypothetical protein UL170_000767 [Clostridioides difficile]|nr:hypothetical protein [Clostridioides difficile]HBG7034000.1 hypothetical protein [Clostridioides difficile]HCU2863280.1 hypothetical protein [Clostridioides difficile]HCU3057186.1 hypothetical protein [Clostridioides difficile]HEL2750975.1 hypothetical protein [Clostridioides difficile]
MITSSDNPNLDISTTPIRIPLLTILVFLLIILINWEVETPIFFASSFLETW